VFEGQQRVDIFDVNWFGGGRRSKMGRFENHGKGMREGVILQTGVGYQADVIGAVDSMDSMQECW